MSSKTPVDERIALLSSPNQRTAGRCLPDSDDLMRELGRILESPAFRRSTKLQDLLCFLVEETLAGRDDGLTAARIAERIFGKEQGFNSSEDPVVRVSANRLRTALALDSTSGGRRLMS